MHAEPKGRLLVASVVTTPESGKFGAMSLVFEKARIKGEAPVCGTRRNHISQGGLHVLTEQARPILVEVA